MELEEGSITTLIEPTRSGYIFDHREGSKHYAGETYTVNEDHSFKAIRTKEQKEEKNRERKLRTASDRRGRQGIRNGRRCQKYRIEGM